jgi:hypothetical protein
MEPLTDNEQRLLELLKDHESLGPVAAANQLNLAKEQVTKLKDHLKAKGLISTGKGGSMQLSTGPATPQRGTTELARPQPGPTGSASPQRGPTKKATLGRSEPSKKNGSPFEQAFRNIDAALWKDPGCTSELDYTEQTSWILFLKYLDDLETVKQMEAELQGKSYTSIIEAKYRWPVWACPKDAHGKLDHHKALSGKDLVEFVNQQRFPYLKGFKQKATGRTPSSTRSARSSARSAIGCRAATPCAMCWSMWTPCTSAARRRSTS